MCKYSIDVQKLKIAMIRMNIDSYFELANQSNISRNTVSDIVNGKSKPNLAIIYAIAETLKLSTNEAGEIFFATNIA